MTSPHRTAAWFALTRQMRPIIEAQLPLPCVNCGRPVAPGTRWHVGHIVDARLDPSRQYDPTNVGAAHPRCNTSAGGKLGARIRNGRGNARPTW